MVIVSDILSMDSLKSKINESLNKLRENDDGAKGSIANAQDFLYAHPKETVVQICALCLSKYDSNIAELIKRIGSPVADRCAHQLLELIIDINWPVHLSAVSALFSLSTQAIKSAIDDAIFREQFREIDAFCFHLKQEKPELLVEFNDELVEVINVIKYYLEDSHIMAIYENIENR